MSQIKESYSFNNTTFSSGQSGQKIILKSFAVQLQLTDLAHYMIKSCKKLYVCEA